MLGDVALTPDASAAAPTGIVVDVIRATSTICQALASGYERVLCTVEVEDARRLRDELEGVTLGGERLGVRIEGFDLGNSPSEVLEPRSATLVMSTTNGTRAIVVAAGRCERVLVGSLLNLDAVVAAALAHGEDVAVFCAGVKGALALDDAYVAGRIVEELGCERTDAAEAVVRLVSSYGGAEEALRQSRSGRNLIGRPELEPDIALCARESVLDVVPRFTGVHGVAAEIRA
ncbi:MAG: 2-phosphosulfolactate phosphatase [Thermoleophilia bacterium]|nr:2-phosphosulfolactate phosphatase [Thermoleophilia bacterium]MDH5334241.1 2-phosphosulfolactate phosphatase [Thermoleophilia bacterium]